MLRATDPQCLGKASEVLANVHASLTFQAGQFAAHHLRHTGDDNSSNETHNNFSEYLHDIRLHLSKLLVISGIEQNPGMPSSRARHNRNQKQKRNATSTYVGRGGEFVRFGKDDFKKEDAVKKSKSGKKLVDEEKVNYKEKYIKGADQPELVEVERRRRQFTLSDVMGAWIQKKQERNRLHLHHERSIPFSPEALLRLSHTDTEAANDDSLTYRILVGKWRAQRNACQRVRARIRKFLTSNRASTSADRLKLRTQLKATVPLHSADVEAFLQKGTLRVKVDDTASKLFKIYLGHGILDMDDVTIFLDTFGPKLGIPPFDHSNTENFIARYEAYACKYAHYWLRPFAMNPGILNVVLNTPVRKTRGIEHVLQHNGAPVGFVAAKYHEPLEGSSGLGRCWFGPWYCGHFWHQYFSRKHNWIYHDGALTTIQRFSHSNNRAYSIIKRMLLLLAGIEPNPGWNAELLNVSALFGRHGFSRLADFFSSTIFEVVGREIRACLYLTQDEDPKAIPASQLAKHTRYIRKTLVFKEFDLYQGTGEELNSVVNRGRGDSMSEKESISCTVKITEELLVNNVFNNFSAKNLFDAVTDIVGTCKDYIEGNEIISQYEESGVLLDNILNITKLSTTEIKKMHEVLIAAASRQKMSVSETKKRIVVQASTIISILLSEGNGLATFAQPGCGATTSKITTSRRTLLTLASPLILTFMDQTNVGRNQLLGCTQIVQTLPVLSATCGLILCTQRTSSILPFIGSGVLYLAQKQGVLTAKWTNNSFSKVTQNALFANCLYHSMEAMTWICPLIWKIRQSLSRTWSAYAARATTSQPLNPKTLMQSLLESEKDTQITSICAELMPCPTNTKQFWDLTSQLSTNACLKPKMRAAIFLLKKYQFESAQSSSKDDLDMAKYLQQISALSSATTAEPSMKSFGFYFTTFFETLLQKQCWISCEKCMEARTPADFLALQPQLLKHLCLELCGQAQPTVLSTCLLCRTSGSARNTLSLQQHGSSNSSMSSMDASKAMMELLQGAQMLYSHVDWVSTSSSNNTKTLLLLLSAELLKIMILQSSTPIQSKQSVISLYSSLNSAMDQSQTQPSDSEQKPSRITTNTPTPPSSAPSPTPCSNTLSTSAEDSVNAASSTSSSVNEVTTAASVLLKPLSRSEQARASELFTKSRLASTTVHDCLLKRFLEYLSTGNCPLNETLNYGREAYHTPYGWKTTSTSLPTMPTTTSIPTQSIGRSLIALTLDTEGEALNNIVYQLTATLDSSRHSSIINRTLSRFFALVHGSHYAELGLPLEQNIAHVIRFLISWRPTFCNLLIKTIIIALFYNHIKLLPSILFNKLNMVSAILGESCFVTSNAIYIILTWMFDVLVQKQQQLIARPWKANYINTANQFWHLRGVLPVFV